MKTVMIRLDIEIENTAAAIETDDTATRKNLLRTTEGRRIAIEAGTALPVAVNILLVGAHMVPRRQLAEAHMAQSNRRMRIPPRGIIGNRDTIAEEDQEAKIDLALEVATSTMEVQAENEVRRRNDNIVVRRQT